MPKRPARQQLLIENDVQGSLVLRGLFYGVICMTYFTVIQFFTQSLHYPGLDRAEVLFRLADEAVFWVPGFLILGPLMVYDMLRVSNRFAGPVFALRRQQQSLIDGKPTRALNLRDDDYWDCIAGQYNQIREEILRLREENEVLKSNAPQEPAATEMETVPVSDLGDEIEIPD